MRTTTDRGDIIHFAGFHHLSPALDGRGAPAFSAEPGDGLTRCGWETFFLTMGMRELGMVYVPEDAGSARFVWEHAGSSDAASDHGGLGAAMAHARRFWKALFPALLLLVAPGSAWGSRSRSRRSNLLTINSFLEGRVSLKYDSRSA